MNQDAKVSLKENKEIVYRLKVSFISKGSGTDASAKKKFLAFINNYEKEHNITFGVISQSWGREGEIDYCLLLDNVGSKEQDVIVNQIKDLLKLCTLVRYFEYVPCKR